MYSTPSYLYPRRSLYTTNAADDIVQGLQIATLFVFCFWCVSISSATLPGLGTLRIVSMYKIRFRSVRLILLVPQSNILLTPKGLLNLT